MVGKFERQAARVLPQVAAWFLEVGVSVFESIMWILKVRDMQASAVGDV